MTAIKIFSHSLRQVFGNLPEAIRIFWPAILSEFVYIGLQVIWIGVLPGQAIAPDDPRMKAYLLVIFGGGLGLMVVGAWCAVAWHRFVLLAEYPRSAGAFHGRAVTKYILAGIRIALLIFLIAIVPGILLGVFGGRYTMNFQSSAGLISFSFFALASVLAFLFLLAIVLRYSAALPGIAIGEVSAVMEGWRRTSGHMTDILLLTFMLAVTGIVLSAAAQFVAHLLPPNALMIAVVIVLQIATYIVSTALGLSVMTTMYGYYFENRPLR